MLHFAYPGLLLGLLAALVPVAIHLMLRPRPRRLRFPALALLKPALLSGQRAKRVRNWLLLALRAAAVAACALLLAGPTCSRARTSIDTAQPTACVVVLDDSLSTSYRRDATRTVYDDLLTGACQFLATESWPPSSTFAAVRLGTPEPIGPFADAGALADALRSTPRGAPHARPLGRGLEQAATLLHALPQPSRQLLVCTDLAAHAWRDVSPGMLSGLDGLVVRVVGPPAESHPNLAILDARVPTRVALDGVASIRAVAGANDLTADAWLMLENDQPIERAGPIRVAPEAPQDVVLESVQPRPGPHAATLELHPADRLDFDQRRYVAWQTARRPVVRLITARPEGVDVDVTTLILRNLLAPSALPAERQLVDLRVFPPAASDRATARGAGDVGTGDERPPLIIVLSGAEVDAPEREMILRNVEQGSTLLLVPGSSRDAADWTGLRPLLATAPPDQVELPTATAIRWDPEPPPDDRGAALRTWSQTPVRRRVQLGPLVAGTTVLASYTDGIPAVVSRRLGAGRIVLLTTAPDPQWSDLGIRAVGLLTWLHVLLDDAGGPPAAVASFAAGEVTRRPFAALHASGLVRVTASAVVEPRDVWVRLRDGVPDQPWPTAVAGIYRIHEANAAGVPALYAVNWPAEESDLTPITPDRLRAALGRPDATITYVADGGTNRTGPGLGDWLHRTSLRDAIALALLVLLTVEPVLARSRGAQQKAPNRHIGGAGP